MNAPDYKMIFLDILQKKYPEKKEKCKIILKKNKLSALDIIELNNKIFENSGIENIMFNQKHRSYKKSDIFRILDFQKKNNLNNVQLANHFNLSRNTVTKWKKMYII